MPLVSVFEKVGCGVDGKCVAFHEDYSVMDVVGNGLPVEVSAWGTAPDAAYGVGFVLLTAAAELMQDFVFENARR